MFKLEILSRYYHKNRQVGHTTAMLNGAKSDKNILVVIHNTQKSWIDLPKEQLINMDNLDERLKGRISPILVDHFALQFMYEDIRKELDKKDEKIKKLENKLERESKRLRMI